MCKNNDTPNLFVNDTEVCLIINVSCDYGKM